jgi:hypothetical protein
MVTPTPVPFTATPTTSPTTVLPTFTATNFPAATVTQMAEPTITAGENIVDIRVANGSDDVEENSSGTMDINSGDLELVYDTSVQVIGIRFNGVKIPMGATITNAYIQFKADETNSKAVNLTVFGEASANASAFSNTARNVSNRSRISNSVTWSPSPWLKVGEKGTAQQTPNLKSIVQEIVNQSNWNSGNSIVMIIAGNDNVKRVAKSFEGNSAGAPLLHVEFSNPAQSQSQADMRLLPTDIPSATLMVPLAPPTIVITETIISTEALVLPILTPTAETTKKMVTVNDNKPVITSNDSFSITENTPVVSTITAMDADLPAQPLTYSISGGADSTLFNINATTGELTFITVPDFESPVDVGIDNVYNVTIQVSDGAFITTQDIAVTVRGANQP